MSANTVKNKPRIIGLTGGIATGKSTVANYLMEKGYPIIDSDLIVKNLYLEDQTMILEIETLFNVSANDIDFKKKIADQMYANPLLRKKIDAIIHPRVYEKILEAFKSYQDAKTIILDAPLLFEAGIEHLCDLICLVYVDLEVQISRLMHRNHLSREASLARIHAQMPLKDKVKLSNYILDNNGDFNQLYTQIDQMLEEMNDENKGPH